ncbi:MAG: hypothetical protein L6R35_007584, partial [Caloplaca aegaea]
RHVLCVRSRNITAIRSSIPTVICTKTPNSTQYQCITTKAANYGVISTTANKSSIKSSACTSPQAPTKTTPAAQFKCRCLPYEDPSAPTWIFETTSPPISFTQTFCSYPATTSTFLYCSFTDFCSIPTVSASDLFGFNAFLSAASASSVRSKATSNPDNDDELAKPALLWR